jgi:hypothetical protein
MVRQSPPVRSEASDPHTRPGKIRGAFLDALDELGGTATTAQLCEKLGRNPDRARDLTRRKRPGSKGRDGLLVWLVEAGVITVEGDQVAQTDNWLEALDELRRAGGELDADERDRARHERERVAYRTRHKSAPAPEASYDGMNRGRERREAELLKDVGSIDDLERVPDADREIVDALRRALVRWPDKLDDYPSWWVSTLHVEDWLPYKPDLVAVEVALYEIRHGRAAA